MLAKDVQATSRHSQQRACSQANASLLYPPVAVHAGIKVNSLAIGAWQWGDKSFWGYDTYGGYGEDEIRQVPTTFIAYILVNAAFGQQLHLITATPINGAFR